MTLAHNIVCLALPGNRRLRGRMLAATVQIVLLPSTLQAEARVRTAPMARRHLLAQMPAAIARIVPRANIAPGLDRRAPTALLGRRLGPLVRHKQAHV